MATKKTVTTNQEKMVESTERNVEAVATKQIYSSIEAPIYKTPVRQRDMIVGHIAAGRLYDYVDKDVNSQGTFYRIKKGYVFVDSNVHMK